MDERWTWVEGIWKNIDDIIVLNTFPVTYEEEKEVYSEITPVLAVSRDLCEILLALERVQNELRDFSDYIGREIHNAAFDKVETYLRVGRRKTKCQM